MSKHVNLVGISVQMMRKAALTAEALAQQTSVGVLLEAEGTVVDGQGAVFQRRAQQGANSLIRRLCGTARGVRG